MKTRILRGLLKVVRWLREQLWWLGFAIIAAIFCVIGSAIAPVPAWFIFVCVGVATAASIAARVMIAARNNYAAAMVATGLLVAAIATVLGWAVRMSF